MMKPSLHHTWMVLACGACMWTCQTDTTQELYVTGEPTPRVETVDWKRKSGPEKFAAYHNAIRTAAGKEAPDYGASYKAIAYERAKAQRGSDYRRRAPLPWMERGPGNVGGRTRGIWVDPADTTSETFFAGSAGGGIWKTEDAGQTWRNLTPDLPNLSTSTIAGSPANPLVLYAGTGEGFGAARNILGDGLWKSIDGGESWSQLSSTAGRDAIANVYRIIVNPDDENEFYFAALSNQRLPGSPPNFVSDIFYSNNGGATIRSVYASTGAVQQIIADPTDFGTIYGTVFSVGVIKSQNAGASWRFIYQNDGFVRMELAISPTHTDHLYLTASGNGSSSNIVASIDGGTHWKEVEPIDQANRFGNWMSGQGWYNNTVAVHPYDSHIVYVGGAGPILELTVTNFESSSTSFLARMKPLTDGYGEYFNRYPDARTKGVHVDHHNLVFVPKDSTTKNFYIINANDGGVAFSRDAGETFLQTGDSYNSECSDPTCNQIIQYETASGYNTAQFYGVDKMNGQDRYVAGTQDNGSWVSGVNPNEASDWNDAPSGDGFEALWHYRDVNRLIESSQFNTLFRSDDGGSTWTNISPPGDGPFLTRVSGSRQDPDLVFAVTSQGVVRSFDFGDSWQIIPMPSGWAFVGLATPVRVSLATPNVVWSGGGLAQDNAMAVSTDGGSTFATISSYDLASVDAITDIATHPLDDSTAYFLFSQANSPKIIRTTDLGATLEDLTGFVGNNEVSSNGYPDVATYCLVVMPYDTDILWAGTEIGLFESTDNGQSWHLADNGLPAASIWDMKIVNDEVVLATHGRGIWTVSLPELEGYEPKPANFLAPMVSLAGDGFGGRVEGSYQLRSAADSSRVVLEYHLDGQPIRQVLPLGENVEPRFGDFAMRASNLVGDLFVDVQVTLETFQEGAVLRSTAISKVYSVSEDLVSGYSNDFDGERSDFARNGWTIERPQGFADFSLNSPHPYSNLSEFVAVFQRPIAVFASGSTVSFDEIVLVEPGESDIVGSQDFFDFCVVEGTTDRGRTWQTLEGYDSRDQQVWLDAYTSDPFTATPELSVNRTLDLADYFNVGDIVYLRFRLGSDPFVEGWGWDIDNFVVGEGEDTDVKLIDDPAFKARLLGNPVQTELVLQVEDQGQKPLAFTLANSQGQILWREPSPSHAPIRQHRWDVSHLSPGLYLLTIQREGRIITLKWLK